MKPVYCIKGHDNPSGSRFCQYCGEELQVPVGNGLYQGMILGDRYRVMRELGHGGFGRTYLAEDTNRFNELCVLKEFAPQVQGTYALQKAEELFEREAGVLYQLQHPQIPKFRELCRCKLSGSIRLFLVQDYVEGSTYRALLTDRKREAKLFKEGEIRELLLALLPVLEYIHSRGVIHRDISPDNLILRSRDGLPVLIDFGGVKQIAAIVETRFMASGAPPVASTPSPVATRLGKVGYAPDEQMQLGVVYPHSDLYALAVTVVVLLTGKEPQQLLDSQTLTWTWRKEVSLSPTLGSVLEKMLAHRESDRYHSAREILEALAPSPAQPTPPTPVGQPHPYHPFPKSPGVPTQLPPEMAEATIPVLPPVSPTPPLPSPSKGGEKRQSAAVASTAQTAAGVRTVGHSSSWGNLLVLILTIALTGSVGWWGAHRWVKSHHRKPVRPAEETILTEPRDSSGNSSSLYSEEELKRKDALRDRRQALGIDYNFYLALVNDQFYAKYPEQQGRTLTSEPADDEWRTRWDRTAAELLDKLEMLSESARLQLGSYDASDRDRWKVAANQLHISSHALNDLADAQFFHWFPEQKGQDFINQPIGQLWQAIATDKLKKLQSKEILETIQFDRGAFRHQVRSTLAPGAGKAYIVSLSKGQIIRLNLEGHSPTKLSIYTPSGKTPPLLEDSTEVTWSGQLLESGYYEIVIVSDAPAPISYHLDIAADNVNSPSP